MATSFEGVALVAAPGPLAAIEQTAADVQCGTCGWPSSSHVGDQHPSPSRALCGSCDAGLSMTCTCVDPPAVAAPEPVDGPAVRRWAADNGILCSSRGRIPIAILDAYRAAHPAVTS